MLLTLSCGDVHNTTFTSESGIPLYVSSTPPPSSSLSRLFLFLRLHLLLRLRPRATTTILKYVSDDPQLEINERFTVVGEIEWGAFGPATFRIGGLEIKSDVFMARHGVGGR